MFYRNLFAVSLSLVVLFFCSLAFAADIYVDVNSQNPLKDGDFDSPFDNVQTAINASSPGDIIYISEGIYNGDLSIDSKGISLIGDDPLTTIVSGTSTTINVSGTYSSGSSVKISGLSIVNGVTRGVYFSSSTLVATIKNCIINNNTRGIMVATSGTKVNILNNTISNNSSDGIWADQYNTNPIINIYNNILTENNRGVFINDGTANCYYNNSWSNVTGDYTGCDYSIGNISDDPNYLNGETGDFRLASTSPSIDAGAPSQSDVDPDGTRNDQGAFGGPGAAAFWPGTAGGPVVTDLTILTPSIPSGGTLSFQATGEIK